MLIDRDFIHKLIASIESFQHTNLINDTELSVMAGLSQSLISKIKTGRTTPSMRTIKKLKRINVTIPSFRSKNDLVKK